MDESTGSFMGSWHDFVAAWELFREPTLTSMLAGACLGWLGVYVVLRRMVFVSAAASQTASLGIVLGLWMKSAWGLVGWFSHAQGWGLLLSILTLGGLTRAAPGTRRDAWLGGIYVLGSAGTLALAPRIVDELADINNLIFGSAVAVSPEDYTASLWLVGALAVLQIWWGRGFAFAALDPIAARVQRVPVRLLDWTFVVQLALAVSWFTKVMGALPTFAFAVVPALSATRVCKRLAHALVLAAALGAMAGWGGYFAAFAWNLPVGAAQGLVSLGLWGVTQVVAFGLEKIQRGRTPVALATLG